MAKWADHVTAQARILAWVRSLSEPSKNRKTRRKSNPGSSVFPFATLEERRLQNLALAPVGLVELIRRGLSPRRGDPTAWYDRAIRLVGGIILLLCFLAMIAAGWMRVLRKS